MAVKSALYLVLALTALAPLGCEDKPATPAPAASTAAAPATTAAASTAAPAASSAPAAASGAPHGDKDRGMHPGSGPTGMLLHAARGVAKDDQKAKLDDIEKKLKTDDGPKDEMKALHTHLAAGVKAGKIDKAKLDTDHAAIEKAMKARHDAEADALNALHAALDATQRKAVVADVKAKQAKREEHMAGKKDEPKKDAPDMAKRKVERLTKELGLDDAQKKKVEAIVPKDDPAKHTDMMAEMKKRMDALLTAFEKDTFDAKKLEGYDAKKARAPMEAEVKFLTELLAILKPEQREKLATQMEKRGMGGMQGWHGRGGDRHHGRGDGKGDGKDDKDDD
jgi:Spy/CpxP family protein refolding chaperone